MPDSDSLPIKHDYALEAIRQQVCILMSHTSCELSWSPAFVREHALMIFQLADAHVRVEENRVNRLTGHERPSSKDRTP